MLPTNIGGDTNSANVSHILGRLKTLEDVYSKLSRIEVPKKSYFEWTGWTPTFTGFSSNPTDVMARYCLIGKLCMATFHAGSDGTSNANSFTISAPMTAATVTNASWRNALAFYRDGGTTYRGRGYVSIDSAGTVFTLWNESGATSWTTTGGKRASFTIIYEAV